MHTQPPTSSVFNTFTHVFVWISVTDTQNSPGPYAQHFFLFQSTYCNIRRDKHRRFGLIKLMDEKRALSLFTFNATSYYLTPGTEFNNGDEYKLSSNRNRCFKLTGRQEQDSTAKLKERDRGSSKAPLTCKDRTDGPVVGLQMLV